MKKHFKRALATALSSAMILSCIPVYADTVSENDTPEITDQEELSFEQVQQAEDQFYEEDTGEDIFSYDWKNATDEELSQFFAVQNPEDIRIWLKTLTEEEKDELLSRNTFLTQPYSVVNSNGEVEDFDTFFDYLNSMPQRLKASIANCYVEYRIRIHFPNQLRTILCRQMSNSVSPFGGSLATPNTISDVHGTRWRTAGGGASILYSVSSTDDDPASYSGSHCPSTVYINQKNVAAFPFIFQIEKPANCFINPTYCNVNTTIYNTIYNTDYPNFTVNGEIAPQSFSRLDQRTFDIEDTGGSYRIKVNKLCLDTDASFSQFQNGQTIQFMILPTFMESGFLDTLPTNKYAVYDLYFNQPIVRVQTDATISFKNLNNQTVNNFTQSWGEKLTLRGLSVAEKTGYQLKDWYILNTDQYTKQTKKYYIDNYLTPTITNTNIERGGSSTGDVTNYIDVTAHAEWTPITYSVRYNANGGSGNMDTSAHIYDQGQALNTNSFFKKGYTFAGWATTADGNVTYADRDSVKNLTTENGGTVNLYAKWTPNTYKVIYQPGGGVGSMEDSIHTYDTAKTLSKNTFTKVGYHFKGWAESDGGSMKYEDEASVKNLVPEGTTKLYALWDPNIYTITYKPNGGVIDEADADGNKKVSVTYDSNVPTPPTASKTGYTLTGWNGAVTGKYTTASNSEATAQWAPNTYTIKFDLDGGKFGGTFSNVNATYDETVSIPAPTRTGYSFFGWQAGETTYTPKSTIKNLTAENNGTVTLKALWRAMPFRVTLNANGGTLPEDWTAFFTASADDVKTLPVPTKDPVAATQNGVKGQTKYTFATWIDDKGYPCTDTSGFTSDVTLTAQYNETFVKTNEVTAPDDPTKPTDNTPVTQSEISGAVTAISSDPQVTQQQAQDLVDALIATNLSEGEKRQVIDALSDGTIDQTQAQTLTTAVNAKESMSQDEKTQLLAIIDELLKRSEGKTQTSSGQVQQTQTTQTTPVATQSQQQKEPSVSTQTPSDTPAVSLKKPGSFKVKKQKGKAKLTWKKVTGATKYEVRYADNKSFKKAKTKTTSKLTLSLKLKKGKTWYIQVRAINGDNKGKWSGKKKVKMK